jgi:molecular chaperone DnaJ
VAQVDFYVILGVERSASRDEVGRAYRRLARRYHPGINPGDGEAEAFFRIVTEAYETLWDPVRRREYDAHGARENSPRPASIEFQGFDFSPAGGGSGTSATFEELFSDVFAAADARAGGSPGQPERGSDLFGEVALSFEEAVHGTERRLTVTRLDVCEECRGSGRRRAVEASCAPCHGTGTTRRRRGHMVFAMRCGACEGTGLLRFRPCATCRERGVAARDEEIVIHVPAGVADGSRLRIEAKGNAGLRGGEPGDLYIVAKVGRHRILRREGQDLHLDLPVAIHEAALGAAVDVPTLDGSARLRVPPGTRSGQRFRLREHGVPSPRRDGVRGDLVVTVHVVLPPVADERSKALLREFGRIHAADVRRGLFED